MNESIDEESHERINIFRKKCNFVLDNLSNFADLQRTNDPCPTEEIGCAFFDDIGEWGDNTWLIAITSRLRGPISFEFVVHEREIESFFERMFAEKGWKIDKSGEKEKEGNDSER